jgi:hypothetical protein
LKQNATVDSESKVDYLELKSAWLLQKPQLGEQQARHRKKEKTGGQHLTAQVLDLLVPTKQSEPNERRLIQH